MLRGKTGSSSRASESPSRGSWRGRGGWSGIRRGRGGWHTGKDKTFKATIDDTPVGRLVTELTLDDAISHDTSAADARISNCSYAASYSLVDSKPAKVIVPGQPAAWGPPELPVQLPGDQGDFLRDQNGARFPEHPMQPSVQALFTLDQTFDPSSVDIMGCASSLGDILRFTRSIESTFRYDVEMVGNTLFLIRNCKDQVIPDVRGYGHSFLDTFTSYGAEVEGTRSHQRIINYSFGGLKCLVRYECDGYLTTLEGAATSVKPPKSIDSPSAAPSIPVTIQQAGNMVPQESILEIKTMSQARGQIEKSDHLPRLWLRQIPNFITAYHTRGTFESVENIAVHQDLLRWEDNHQADLRRFASLLHQLVIEVKRTSHLKLELCRAGQGPLQLRQQVGKTRDALPQDWKEKWAELSDPYAAQESGHRLSSDGDDDYDDGNYPSTVSSENNRYGSDGSDDDFSLDYTACDIACGYCGHCAY